MIHIESGLFQCPEKLVEEIVAAASCHNYAIISDTQVAVLYGNPLLKAFLKKGISCHLITFPSGEQSKTRETKEKLENSCFEKGLGKDSAIIALGGGVTTDLVGFLAATYCRGVPLISIPTSFLAMVDAAFGGKTGVNCSYGKNLIGCLYEPKKIIIDTQILKTQELKGIKEGLVEVIKYAIILKPKLFDYLVKHADMVLSLQENVLEHLIHEGSRTKVAVVRKSKKVMGIRNLLNFGHTIGHALESVSNHTLTHGEAVAIGIMVESEIAVRLGVMQEKVFERIQNLFELYGISTQLPASLSIEKIMDKMILDKKSLEGKPRFVMVAEIGRCLECDLQYCKNVDEGIVRQALAKQFKL
jgi:3-dehydroquinate synthase